jgi:diaminopimelate epimerase
MQLTKHHGLGNDFLVLLDLEGTHPITASDAVALCDRRTGIGADGLLRVTTGTGGAQVTMELLNADGSTAEMSGNGVRCVAQAALRAGVVTGPVIEVATDSGLRIVRVLSHPDPATHRMSVDMGQAKVVGREPAWEGAEVLRAARVEIGNPHIVLLWAGPELPDEARLVDLGSTIDAATPGGANVELVVAGSASGAITMSVYERGVGPTLACGTGACAAAAAAHEWGLCDLTTSVQMPGGPVEVTLGDPVVLTGDVMAVATIDPTWP